MSLGLCSFLPFQQNIIIYHHHTVHVQYLCQWVEGKHYQCKLQWVMTTTCTSGVFVLKIKAQGLKVRTNISASLSGMQQQHATPTTTNNQLRIRDQDGLCWSAKCSDLCNLCKGTLHVFVVVVAMRWWWFNGWW